METFNEKKYGNISPELFQFAQEGVSIHDRKLSTKSRSYLGDAFLRFKKNKSSLVAAVIIGILVLYALVVPLVSPYTINNTDNQYTNYPPFIAGSPILNGSVTYHNQNENQYQRYLAIKEETGREPIIAIKSVSTWTVKERGNDVEKKGYTLEVNKYYAFGAMFLNVSVDEYKKIQDWQNQNDIQVIYPAVDPKQVSDTADANSWYKCDKSGEAKLDKNGKLIPVYLKNQKASPNTEYNSKRVAGDDGSYAYCIEKDGGSVRIRIDKYNYYKYINGVEPAFLFGTDEFGHDLMTAIAIGARFSLIFAVIVSVINLTIGAIYGAIQGYYGGITDLIMDRIADILSGVPFMVTATLFQLHLARKVGTVPSFLFAFVLTGWIGMSALTRKQFYRFKGQEFVYAAKTLGASDARLMFKHIFPNSLGTIITSCALVIPGVINSETNLTYLGIVNLSELAGTTIGVLMEQGQRAMTQSPHAMFFPAIFVSLLLISFNLFGNGLRDAFNPSTRGVED